MSAKKYAAGAGFLACILAANYVTTEYGMVPVGFGLIATAGTYFAGLSFVLRDAVQDTAGKRWVFVPIVAGALLSYLVSAPFIALASGVAFLVSELADLAVYTPLRRRGYVRAAVASNVVGAFVDTVLFLWVAGFPIQQAIAGQMVGKLLVTLAVVGLVLVGRRTVWRHVVRTCGPEVSVGPYVSIPVACKAWGCNWTHDPLVTSTIAEAEGRMTALHNGGRRS